MVNKDYLAVIEEAYAVDRNHDDWMQAVAERARPIMDCGLGTVTFVTDLRQRKRPIPSRPYVAGEKLGPEHGEFFLSDEVVDPETRERLHLTSPIVATGSEVAGDQWAASAKKTGPFGMLDFLAVNHVDPSGFCLTLGAPLETRRSATESERKLWSRVAAHLGAGYRLRERLQVNGKDETPPLERAEAVLDSHFKVVDASGEAADRQEELRVAARAIDRARTELRAQDPSLAINLWKGLVSGRWSVIDHFDTDGKRFFVAQENTSITPAPKALTPQERQVAFYAARGYPNKLIAYHLGLPIGSVHAHLTSAMKKLGIESRGALIQLLAALKLGEDADPA